MFNALAKCNLLNVGYQLQLSMVSYVVPCKYLIFISDSRYLAVGELLRNPKDSKTVSCSVVTVFDLIENNDVSKQQRREGLIELLQKILFCHLNDILKTL